MKEFFDYIAKNKYVVICVAIVVVLYALGVVDFLTKAVVLIALLGLAIFVGKKLQDNESYFKDLYAKFKTKRNTDSNNVYYYQTKETKEDKK